MRNLIRSKNFYFILFSDICLVVAAFDPPENCCLIVTAYRPDLKHFEPDFKILSKVL
jgi:hypothetical protein